LEWYTNPAIEWYCKLCCIDSEIKTWKIWSKKAYRDASYYARYTQEYFYEVAVVEVL
jgi:hypothetical protein